ncbi:hypothetical protein GALMADRAFT_1089568 [Galerina marginata CBS 339.88]|uniref:G domain-containing protein n=1 Tax=Galerina marginata (strain CBS 339.88) TaxID=685588 RepID=A0A067TNL2_GALM3|nr:hypothetical protein GALMADRAFT_1089568 [Galerina marginata CBS 339.88]
MTEKPMKRPQSRNAEIADVDILKDGKESDIVIPIMGPTGSGKTTFVNTALQEDRLEVGHSVNSATSKVRPIVIDPIPGFPALSGHRLVLVDTPGFDDTFVDDVQILKKIAKWLAKSYRKGMVIGGVLYLHDISIKRFTGTARKNLDMFHHLCGDAALNKVVLSTTSWYTESCTVEVHERRERELKTVHWKHLIDQGAEVYRFLRDRNSAWEIINVFLKNVEGKRPALLIQTEMVDRRLRIPETEAGQALLLTLQQALETHKKITMLEATIAEDGDPSAKAKLDEAQANIVKLKAQIQAIKLSLPQRVLKWIGFY